MAKPHRSPVGATFTTRTFFVTSVTWERRQLFRSARMAQLFLDVIHAYRAKGQFLLHEFTLMPDHFHLLVSLPPQVTLEKAIQLVKGGFSFRAACELGFKSEIWQRGFADLFIPDTEEYETRRRYIRQNAVHRRLVERAENYPYCSAFPGFELDPPPAHLKG